MKFRLFCLMSLVTATSYGEMAVIPMYETQAPAGTSGYVGNIVATDSPYGLMLNPHLSGLVPYLAPGPHGFHVHSNPSCANAGMAAGEHFDPNNTGQHLGPYNLGHLGDLPVISVDNMGNATVPIVAPRLTVKDILGHSLMIHAGSDTYSNQPKLGGGGMRMVCGVVPNKPAMLISDS